MTLGWEEFSRARFVINGVAYQRSVGDLFAAAHGDAHNANVWYSESDGAATLSFFDPAFAGENVPTLLAEVKTTFHNILAHPLWLYDPDAVAERYSAEARYADGVLSVETNWR